jgi:hypothetical protein
VKFKNADPVEIHGVSFKYTKYKLVRTKVSHASNSNALMRKAKSQRR